MEITAIGETRMLREIPGGIRGTPRIRRTQFHPTPGITPGPILGVVQLDPAGGTHRKRHLRSYQYHLRGSTDSLQ